MRSGPPYCLRGNELGTQKVTRHLAAHTVVPVPLEQRVLAIGGKVNVDSLLGYGPIGLGIIKYRPACGVFEVTVRCHRSCERRRCIARRHGIINEQAADPKAGAGAVGAEVIINRFPLITIDIKGVKIDRDDGVQPGGVGHADHGSIDRIVLDGITDFPTASRRRGDFES